MRKYRLHYRTDYCPAPYQVSNVLCPDGRQRTCSVWCWEGDHCEAEIVIRGQKIAGNLNLTKKFYNAMLYPESMPDVALFAPDDKEAFWKVVGGKPRCVCGADIKRDMLFSHLAKCPGPKKEKEG